MFKKLVLLSVVVLSALLLPVQASWRNDEITMLVMPREAIPLQIAQDISRRYPVMIVSYQMVRGDLKIHAWNGDSWVFVSVEDYTNGTFFANRPKHAIVVENERLHAPAVLVPGRIWCESASRLASTDPRALIHLMGLHFDFPYRHWDQLAKRYGYSLEQVNPTLENVHWWNLRADRFIEKRGQRDFSADLDKWHYLETLPPPVIAPVTAPAAPVKIETGATAVDITAKAPEAPVEKAPAVKPVPVAAPAKIVEPAAPPAAKPAPAVEAVKAIEPAPIAEPVSSVESVATETPAPSPAVEVEKAVAAPVPAPIAEPAAVVEADPFSADEIPAAEIVVPQESKKPWWKLF